MKTLRDRGKTVQAEEEKRKGGPEKDEKVRCVAIFSMPSIKGIVQPKIKSLSSFTNLNVFPTLYEFFFFFLMEHTD